MCVCGRYTARHSRCVAALVDRELIKTYIENQIEHVGKSRPTLDMFRSRYSSIKAKRSNGSKVMQRKAMLSKAKQCTVMQSKCLKTGTASFVVYICLVYLYFLVVHITELNLLRALS